MGHSRLLGELRFTTHTGQWLSSIPDIRIPTRSPVAAHQNRLRNLDAERLGGFQIDYRLEHRRLLNLGDQRALADVSGGG